MATLFTKIIEGDLPGVFVWKDQQCVAFMSINPLRAGHTLVVPRLEVDHWLDCPDDVRDHLMSVARRIGQAQQQVYRPIKVGLMIAGLEVPHLHIHVVPMDSVHDLDFGNAGSASSEELEQEAESMRYVLRAKGHSEVEF